MWRCGKRGVQAFIDVISIFMLNLANFLDIFKAGDMSCQSLDFPLQLCDFGVRHCKLRQLRVENGGMEEGDGEGGG
jgi:hypothetical protein